MTHRCVDCGEEFTGQPARWSPPMCPRCVARERDIYDSIERVDVPTARWSRAAMRERLGITGNVDE